MTPDRRRFLAMGASIGIGAGAGASAGPRRGIRAVTPLADGIRYRDGADIVEVRLALAGVASVVRYPADRTRAHAGLFTPDAEAGVAIADAGDAIRLTGDGIIVVLEKRTGRLAFLTADAEPRLSEGPEPAEWPGVAATRRCGFTVATDAPLHGLGQFREPVLDYRGHDVFLAHANSDAVCPLLVSPAGWGLLWETATAAQWRARGRRLEYHSLGSDVVRYHVCVGTGADGAIAGYRALTGAASLLPRWAYGYWQSKERYQSQRELLDVAAEYRRRRLPLDALVLDWRYWGENDRFSAMTFDKATFPEPAAMVRDLHARDVRLLASIWPAFGPGTAIHRDMAAGGHLFAGEHWSGGHVFDTSSAAARAIYWRYVKAGLLDVGIDGLWTDGNEPEFRSTGERYGTTAAYASRGVCAAGPIPENQLTFSWWQAKGLAEGMRRDWPRQRPLILSRSAYAGQQAFGAVTWSGDIFASWGTLSNQVVAAVNFAMAGIPWWTCDIGGFLVNHRFPRGLADPAYVELYVRWFQFAAFLPVFRAHGTHVPRELWRFGEPGTPAYDALEAALRKRYALFPHIYTLAADAALRHGTMVRGLAMDFPGDAAAARHPAQYMFGRDLLVRVVDRPLRHAPANGQEFIPNRCVRGRDAPAATIAFYEGADFDRKVGERLTDDLKLSWNGDLPEQLAGKPYSIRIAGELVPEETGVHAFVMMGKGRLHITVGGKVLVDAATGAGTSDGADGAVSFREHEGDGRWEAEMALTAGKPVRFVIEQRQASADVVSLWVEWLTPTQRAKLVPPPDERIEVYLPVGARWRPLGGGALTEGGRTMRVAAPLAAMPVFVRAGAIIPTSPGIDRAVSDGPVELNVYSGADGTGELYVDGGDGDGYRSGEHRWIGFRWDDRARSLAIDPGPAGATGIRLPRLSVRVIGDERGPPVAIGEVAGPVVVQL